MEQLDIDILKCNLKAMADQLRAEQQLNNQLRIELEECMGVKLSVSANLEKMRTTLQMVVKEKEQLKAQNELLGLELAECQRAINTKQAMNDREGSSSHQGRWDYQAGYSSEGNQSGKSSASSSRRNSNSHVAATRDDSEKILHLEQQVISLTRDKKQLMTHLHWLTRQRSDPSPAEDQRKQLEASVLRMSLEEGSNYGAQEQALAASQGSFSGPSLMRSKRFECFSRHESVDDGVCSGRKPLQEDYSDKRAHNDVRQPSVVYRKEPSTVAITDRLRSLKEAMLAVKALAANNNSLSDTIFQLSFQHLKHRNEPRSYSNWSSYDEEGIPQGTFLGRASEIPNWIQESNFGYRSLEAYPQKYNADGSSFHPELLRRKKSSASSPELFLSKEKGVDSYFHILSKSTMQRVQKDNMMLSRSLSDQQTRTLFDKEKPVFSTLVSADETLIDNPESQVPFSSLGFLAAPVSTTSNAENERSLSTSSTVNSEALFSENLIS